MPLEKNIDKPVMTLGLHQVRTPCANGMANHQVFTLVRFQVIPLFFTSQFGPNWMEAPAGIQRPSRMVGWR